MKEVSMLDHVGFTVTDYAKAKAFYERALKPLGISLLMELAPEQTGGVPVAGFGEGQKPYFWFGTGEKPTGGQHIAFAASDRKTVDEFYAAAIAAGGRDNGKPGPRPHYHADYYGAFVLDPDGNNIEAVCHRPE
jgi:catechol 2,3-dioxygenase-like lactoylglutathione lyase family enzyme